MRRFIVAALAGLCLTTALRSRFLFSGVGPGDVENRPIPQDPERQRQRFHEQLAWNQKTLAGAYDRVGERDPRWDKPAHEALDAAARFFSRASDPDTYPREIYAPAKAAIDAGCDDPLILYLYARTSTGPRDPGPEELDRRYTAAATAMEQSDYPPVRRMVVLKKAGSLKADRPDLTPEARGEASRLLDAAVELIPRSVTEDGPEFENRETWIDTLRWVIKGHRKLSGDSQAAFDRVDAVIAGTPALKPIRVLVRGTFLAEYAWEGRGTGYANTVTPVGWAKFEARLAEARPALEEAWSLLPNNTLAPTFMVDVEKGSGSDWSEMEKWFARAMVADGDNRVACLCKLDWLDPKWHGSREAMLAFGRACRDTKNWRAGITLLVAEAHRRAAQRLSKEEQQAYFATEDVWNEIKAVYEEYLDHFPADHKARTEYAVYCYKSGRYTESNQHFRKVGKNLAGTDALPEAWLKQVRAYVARQAKKQQAAKAPTGSSG